MEVVPDIPQDVKEPTVASTWRKSPSAACMEQTVSAPARQVVEEIGEPTMEQIVNVVNVPTQLAVGDILEPRGRLSTIPRQAVEDTFEDRISRQVVEGFGDGTIYAWTVGLLHYQKRMGNKGIGGCRKRKARRNARSVAARDFPSRKSWSKSRGTLARIVMPTCQANGKASERNYVKKGKFSEWACAGLREACDGVASEDVGRLSTGHFSKKHRLLEKNVLRQCLVWEA